MKKEEKIKLFRDTFPEIWDALEVKATQEGRTSIGRYINGEIASIVDFFDTL